MTEPGEPEPSPVVHIVDDDDALRSSLVFLLQTVGIVGLHYPDARSFLAEFDPEEPAVVIVDVRMPGMSGFELQEELERRRYPGPVIFCSAHGDVGMSVRAMQHGAVDFLMKPYDPQDLLDAVQRQVNIAGAAFAAERSRAEVAQKVARLTPREREVLAGVIAGLPSQVIATTLGVSVKTVDVHRANIRAKTGAESLGALVRDVLLHTISLDDPA
ncbi:response regulator [Microbacterium sp. LMC-P-041]|uniref:response regulator transcription factor n=1 Tax=Microbacterium sp. LMC-P-041 TaxID=3040293 RepID=UPI002554886F|nr:response regulator [Microbacterium sp. LMC-P-041]